MQRFRVKPSVISGNECQLLYYYFARSVCPLKYKVSISTELY